MKRSRPPRVLFAGLFHETHTFVPGVTALADFELSESTALLDRAGDASPLGGALQAANELGWEVIPALDLRTQPSAMVADEVVDRWWERMEGATRTALETGLDAIYLVLHGAMTSRSYPDVEGELLGRIRSIVGPDMLIAGVTDLHANFTPEMAQHSNALITYRENPHTDGVETARRAALLLDFLMGFGEKAVTYFRSTSIVWPPTGTGTAVQPMSGLEELAREIENADPEIIAVNVHAGYAFADVPYCGVSFTVVSVGSASKAERALDRLERLAWKKRAEGNKQDQEFESLLPALKVLMQSAGQGPVVVAEPSDNIGGGSPGDGTGLLRYFVKHRLANSGVVIDDPSNVKSLDDAEVGERRKLKIGGHETKLPGANAFELEIELVSRSNGKFELEDHQSHMATMMGLNIDMGPCAVVRHRLPGGGGIWILLTSIKTAPMDLGQWRSQGVEPEKLSLIGCKAAVAHKRAYEPIARALFSVNTPGPCSTDLTSFLYEKIRRPVFPLDEVVESGK